MSVSQNVTIVQEYNATILVSYNGTRVPNVFGGLTLSVCKFLIGIAPYISGLQYKNVTGAL